MEHQFSFVFEVFGEEEDDHGGRPEYRRREGGSWSSMFGTFGRFAKEVGSEIASISSELSGDQNQNKTIFFFFLF